MSADPSHKLVPHGRDEEFVFTGKPRKIEPVSAIPFRWPKKVGIANDYIREWRTIAADTLGSLSLSRDTLNTLASHFSRSDGTCRLPDKAIAGRSGRSLTSTKRDIRRLKDLGFLVVEYEGGDRKQERVRILRPAVPVNGRSSQRVPR